MDHANNNTTRISDEQLFPISTLIKSRLKQRYSTNSRMPLLLYPDHFLPIESYFVNLLIEKTIILKETQDLKEHANNNMQEVTEESWQIPQQDKHFTTKEEISVENILQPGSHQKIVVEGYAGAGKSTLCRHITHRWAEGKLWPHYLAVFYIPLRNLVHYPPEHLNLLSVIRKECLSVQQNELFTDNELNLWLQRHEHEIVYINDGYDEIIAANASPSLIKLLQELMAKPVRIVTSRPNFYQTKFDEVSLQVTGFKDSDITTYVRRFLAKFDAEDKINGLLQLIDQNIHLRQIARVPINLELLCSSWLENRGRVKNSAKMAGITNLYEAIIINLLRHNLQRKNTQDTYQWLLIDIWGHPDSQLILTILSEIAWQSFRDRSLIITKKHYQSALIYLTQYVSGLTNDPKAANAYRQELINNIFRNFGLLRTIGLDTLPLTEREFVFAHASFHEFLLLIVLPSNYGHRPKAKIIKRQLHLLIAINIQSSANKPVFYCRVAT
ncbi:MAG: NACHT domain-containing protein [Coxiellaceae bacterium]|nr:MAG: NACHT domain-containing protein [Coxiellaceae bacterium]